MNKEEVERIALEVADSITAPFISDEIMTRFARRFLARIDAERGKEAVAEVRNGYLCELTIPLFNGTKLFLSPVPTIPEGWADAYAAFKGAFDTPQMRRSDNSDYAQDARKRMRDFNESMIAAAQGEK